MIEQLRGMIVGLDTAPLIYFIERHPEYHPLVRPFFVALQSGQFTVVTSTITIVEALVHPLRRKERELGNQYRDILLNAEHLTTLGVTNPEQPEGSPGEKRRPRTRVGNGAAEAPVNKIDRNPDQVP